MSPVMSAEGLVSATATQSQEGMRAGLTLLDPSQARASCVTLPARLVVRRLAVPVTCRVHVVLRAVKPGVCGLPGEHRALRAVLSCASKRGRQPFEAVTQKRLAEPFVEDGEDRNCSTESRWVRLGIPWYCMLAELTHPCFAVPERASVVCIYRKPTGAEAVGPAAMHRETAKS